jgi:hypothetical protein
VKKVREVVLSLLIVLLCSLLGQAQQSVATATDVIVPPLVNFSGVLTDGNGKPLTGIVGVTFYLYKEQEGGAPLWLETQNVQPNSTGHYTVMLGSTTSQGIPANIFASGEAHWLGVQVSGQAEQPRVLLVSAPYALKAGDAETLGGLPPSAFVLAAPQNGTAPANTTVSATGQSVSPETATDVTTSGGTVNFLPLWDTTTDITNSVLFQSGTGTTAKIGINTTTPASTLDIKGGGTIRGTLSLPATGAATATAGKNSQPLNLTASAYNSSTPAAVNQTFQWLAEPAANDTAAPSGTLNLLFGAGTTKPSETGLSIASNGQITFAAGQTFPGTGTGNGTVTSVGSGTGLTGGPITGAGTLSVDATMIPQLAASNTFTGNQTVNGNLSATGVVTGSSFQIGSNLFAFGSYANANAFLGFAGNTTTTGFSNTGSGATALVSNTTGYWNTANGSGALSGNNTGYGNTASGFNALTLNSTGDFNTASGAFSGWAMDSSYITGSNNTLLGTNSALSTGTLNNATAIGANAEVSESNAMVLGEINGVNGATASTNVGIGTTAPGHLLDVAGTTAIDSTGLNNGSNFIDLTFGSSSGEGMSSSRTAGPNQYGIDIYTDFNRRISIEQHGNVGIGTTAPDSLLSVNGSADKPGGGSWGTFSDGRLKNLNGNFNSGLSQVLKLNPVRYRYRPDNAMGIRDTDEHIGVVAQEVQRVIPEAVTENSKGYLLVNNDPIIWTMLNAIKEQQGEIRALKSELRATRQTLQKVKAQVAAAQPALVAAK